MYISSIVMIMIKARQLLEHIMHVSVTIHSLITLSCHYHVGIIIYHQCSDNDHTSIDKHWFIVSSHWTNIMNHNSIKIIIWHYDQWYFNVYIYIYMYTNIYILINIYIYIHINPHVSCLKSQIGCWEKSPFFQLHVSGCPRRALCTDAVYGGGAGVSWCWGLVNWGFYAQLMGG